MPAISAVDAISPAVHRTRGFLFRPFRWGTYLKLCLVAMITEGFGGNFNFSWPGRTSSHRQVIRDSLLPLSHGWVAVIVAASVGAFLLCCFLYYLITRLRFAYFHCLIHNTKEIRPGWRLYRPQAIRFFWLSAVVALCFLLLVALIVLPFVAGFWRLVHTTPVGGHPDVWSVLALILPLLPIIFLVAVVGIATDLILRDLILPHFALENATASQAWEAVRGRIKAEKAAFFVYALLRVVLPIVAMIALFIAVVILGVILASAIAITWFGLHSMAAGASGGVAMAWHLIVALLLVVSLAAVCLLSICLIGPVGTAVREYALVFYGGRYQRLGEILFPPPVTGLGEPGTA